VSTHTITRRDFLRKTTAAAAVAAAGVPLIAQSMSPKKSRVILIRHQGVVDATGAVDRATIEGMIDDAVVALFDAKTPGDAWKNIAGAGDVVGIKTNVWKYLHTPTELEGKLKARCVSAGVRESDIAIDDRGVLSNPVFQKATVLINARPMRAHHWSGVGGCLKNYIMFTPNPSDYHPDSCIDLGAVWKLPPVAGKTRLNVLVMLTPQFHCLGPHHFDKEYIWSYGGLLVGSDPVALDAVGLKILEAKRKLYFKEDSPMRPPVRHIRAAEEKHGIGVANLERIEVRTLGWKEGILI
jgi:hypothetical protein